MNARDVVLDTMHFAEEWSSKPYEEFKKECAAELDAYRAEVLREAARWVDNEDLPQTADDVADFCDGARWATSQLRSMADQTGETP